LYRAPSPDRALLVTGFNDRVIAFRRTDGAVAWAYEFAPLPSGRPHTAPLAIEFTDSRVFVAKPDALLCFDYATGRLLGEVKLPEDTLRPQILIDSGDVFVSTQSLMMCVDLEGRVKWQVLHGGTIHGSPTLALPGNVRSGDSFGYK
jgi:outer membrane protein assembly factor BamB